MSAPQGNLHAGVVGASATPVLFYALPPGSGDPIAYWSTNLRISGHDTQEANVEIWIGTEDDPQTALRIDAAKLTVKGSFSLECLLRSVGDRFFIKSDQSITVHLEGIYELAVV
jgi:hypothetical protein